MSQMEDKPQRIESVEGFSIKEVHVKVGVLEIRRTAQPEPGVKARELENVDDQTASDADDPLAPVMAKAHDGHASDNGARDEGNPSYRDYILTAEPEEFELADQLPNRIKASTVVIAVAGKERKRARDPSGEMHKADMSPLALREMIRAKRAKRPSDAALQGEAGTTGRKRARVESIARGIVKKAKSGRTSTRQNASARRLGRPLADKVEADGQTSISSPETKISVPTKGTKRRRISNAEESSIQQRDGNVALPLRSACKHEDGDDTRATKRFHRNATVGDEADNKLLGSKGLSESRV
ncbi:hypothetical protein EYR38_004965 [Pleurotus pulmonarius]|nr:hypothetical protein EYR38_004965 [Pleurotus pulmonarius]